MLETTDEKTARLRVLRYARDGSPEEHAERSHRAKVESDRCRAANFDLLVNTLRVALRENPKSVFEATVSGKLEKVIKKYC